MGNLEYSLQHVEHDGLSATTSIINPGEDYVIMETYFFYPTICPESSDPFCIVSYYIKGVTTSWTHSRIDQIEWILNGQVLQPR